MIVLGIETSCDETAAAVVEDGSRIRSSIVSSQDDVHAKFGGVVPELASRQHIQKILPITEKALAEAGIQLKDLDGIAVTKGPGLIGSLLVGTSFAKALAFANQLPLIGVHHIEGHLTAALIEPNHPSYPLVGLVVSGGHTNIYKMSEFGKYELMAQTLDDAAGEAFDKVAKLCGLGFPGGPNVEKAALGGNPEAISFPRPNPSSLDFSFSGLKTAVAVWIQKNGLPKGSAFSDLMASFQQAVIDVLISKLLKAVDQEKVGDLVVCGGVAKNQVFRKALETETEKRGLRLHLAPLNLCTDNAAMIAAAGCARLANGEVDSEIHAVATSPLHQ